MIEKLVKNVKKKKIEEIIYTVEEIAFKAKIPTTEAFERINEHLNLTEIANIVENLKKGVSKSEVYKEYVPEAVYIILREGEKRGIPVGNLLSRYVYYKRAYEEMRNAFRSALLFQVIYYSVLAVAGYYLLTKVGSNLIGTKQVTDPSTYYTIKLLYIPVNLIIVAFLLVVALFPFAIPKIKEGFKEMEGARVLGLTHLLVSSGSSMKDILIFFAEDPNVGRYFKGIESYGIEGFIEGVKKLLSPEEVAVLEIAHKGGQFLEGVERLTEYKLSVAKRRLNTTVKFVQTGSVVFGVIPILFVIAGNGYLIKDIFHSVMEKMRRY